jgi:mycofactocin precursor peptide peptidase
MNPAGLGDLRSTDASRAEILAVPVGSTEQHGPHLPLSTDTRIATALADGLAAALPGTIVAPPVPYGSSGEHQGFPGTVSIGQEAVELLLVELARSAGETYGLIVFVNAHGGNAEPLERAERLLRGEDRDVLTWSPSWSGDAHAGRVETSLMLAISPELVSVGAARAGNTAPIAELIDDLRELGMRPLSPNGVLGDPAGASAAEGRRLLTEAVADLAEAIGSRLDRKPAAR